MINRFFPFFLADVDLQLMFCQRFLVLDQLLAKIWRLLDLQVL